MTPIEVYNNAVIRSTIEVFSAETVKKYPMLDGFQKDLEQEMWLFLIKRISSYNPSKASIETFATKILNVAISRFLRSFFADKNQAIRLSKSSSFPADNSIPHGKTCDGYELSEAMQVHSDRLVQEMDIGILKENLSSGLWAVCEKLQEGISIRQMARERQISRRQFYRKYIIPIRKTCCRLGLK